MKTRKMLHLAILAAVLTLAIAAPALAEEPVTMWIQRNRMNYCGRGPGPDRVIAMVHIFDATRAMVSDAEVTAEWTLPDGANLVKTVNTNEQGIAEFSVWERGGDYQICVQGVTKNGWQYDASLNMDAECSSFHVW